MATWLDLFSGFIRLNLTACSARAQPLPSTGISAHRHPNLAAAARLMKRADARIVDAQHANEWDLDSHAARAKQLLEQAGQELKESAQASNRNHR